MNHYLAIDPGEKRTGWALFGSDGSFINMGIVRGIDTFLDWLDERTELFDGWIVENYRVRNQHVNHQYSSVLTLQLIGAIKRAGKKRQIPVHMVESSNLGTALPMIGYERKPNVHVPDHISALAHGTWWLKKQGILK